MEAKMKRKRLKILKIFFTRGLELNPESISNDFSQMAVVLLGALLGGIISISLSKNLTSIQFWLLLIIILAGISVAFKIIKFRSFNWGRKNGI